MVAQRKACPNNAERIRLSKAISKTIRQLTRERATDRTRRILVDFKDLNKLFQIYNEPSRKLDDRSCSPDAFADFFASIYCAEDHIEPSCKEAIRRLPRFSMDELKCALKQMASNRCPDSYGIVC